MTKYSIIHHLHARHDRSAWDKGVTKYALELLDVLDDYEDTRRHGDLRAKLLNGASDWKKYSQGGCSLVFDEDIVRRLATPGVLVKYQNRQVRPNRRETWVDVQTRALQQAYDRIVGTTYMYAE